MKAELLDREQLADRFGVDIRTITNWVGDGMPQRVRSGKPVYAWLECLKWREEQIRKDRRGLREAGDDEQRKEQLAEARLRVALAEAEEAELNLAERRGELVPVQFMRDEFERIAQALRTRLLATPAAWAPRVDAATSLVDRQLVLEDCINELLPLLRAAADDDGEDDGESVEEAA